MLWALCCGSWCHAAPRLTVSPAVQECASPSRWKVNVLQAHLAKPTLSALGQRFHLSCRAVLEKESKFGGWHHLWCFPFCYLVDLVRYDWRIHAAIRGWSGPASIPGGSAGCGSAQKDASSHEGLLAEASGEQQRKTTFHSMLCICFFPPLQLEAFPGHI